MLPARALAVLWGLTVASGLRWAPSTTPHLGRAARAVRMTATEVYEATDPEDLGGAIMNEENLVTVSYSSGAQGRTRRVRRTTRPPLEERWRQQSADLLPVG